MALLLTGPAASALQAQPAGRALGVGGQIGAPAGLTVKLYRANHPLRRRWHPHTLTVLAAWELGQAFWLHTHLADERPLPDSPLHYFFGPGLVLGYEDTRRDADLLLGASGVFGINFFRARFEVYLQAAPRLILFPDTHGHLDAGAGLRYFF